MLLLVSVYLIILFHLVTALLSLLLCFYFRSCSSLLSLPLYPCLGCIPLLIGLSLLRSLLRRMFVLPHACYMVVFCFFLLIFLLLVLLFLVCSLSLLCHFLVSFAGCFFVHFLIMADFPACFCSAVLPVRFGLVHLSCDHSWIRSGSVDVR